MGNPLECRKYVRVRCILRLKHIKFLEGAPTGEGLDSFSKDISAGGISFTSGIAYNLGDIVQLQIDLPGWAKYKPEMDQANFQSQSDTVKVLTKVRRAEELALDAYNIGVAFVDIDAEHQKALDKYIKEQLK